MKKIRATINVKLLNSALLRKDEKGGVWVSVVLHPRPDEQNRQTDGVCVEHTSIEQRNAGLRGKTVGSWQYLEIAPKPEGKS